MKKKSRFPENVIPVDFRKKNFKFKNMQELYPDAFKMYVDTDSENPDKFSKAILDFLQKEKDCIDENGDNLK